MAVHLRQKTSPQHLQWCRLLRRVKLDAHAGLAHAGAFASGTQWDRSTRRGPMASRTRSTTSARREGTRARGAARRGGVCSSGVPGRAGSRATRPAGAGAASTTSRRRGGSRRRRGPPRDRRARKSSPRATRRACAGWRRRTSCSPGSETRARAGPSRGWKCRRTLARPPRTARLPRGSPRPSCRNVPDGKVKSRARHPPSRDFNEAVLATRRRDTKSERAEYAGRTPNVIEF